MGTSKDSLFCIESLEMTSFNQASLLQTSMKNNISISGSPSMRKRRQEKKAFLFFFYLMLTCNLVALWNVLIEIKMNPMWDPNSYKKKLQGSFRGLAFEPSSCYFLVPFACNSLPQNLMDKLANSGRFYPMDQCLGIGVDTAPCCPVCFNYLKGSLPHHRTSMFT